MSDLVEALRKADYDTPYVWDLTAEAANSLASKEALIDEMVKVLEDLCDLYEGNLYSNLAAKRARFVLSKAK